MDAKYLSMLPPMCADAVLRAEQAFGQAVQVVPYLPATRAQRPYLVAARIPVLDMGHGDAHIEAPIEGISRAQLIHEVLHLHRNGVLGVPRLMPIEDRDWGLIGGIENDLEHLVIIPLENHLGAASMEYWASDMFRMVSAARGPLAAVDFQRAWLVMRLAGITGGGFDLARQRLTECGLLGAAEELVKRVARCNGDKLLQCREIVRHFKISLDRFQLQRFVVGVETLVVATTPDWWTAEA